MTYRPVGQEEHCFLIRIRLIFDENFQEGHCFLIRIRLIFDENFPRCYMLQELVYRREKCLNRSPFISASICLRHNYCTASHNTVAFSSRMKYYYVGKKIVICKFATEFLKLQ